MAAHRFILIAVLVLWPAVVAGQGSSLVGEQFAARGPLIAVTASDDVTQGASLFIGRDGQSFFRPFPVRVVARTGAIQIAMGEPALAHIRQVIAWAEAGAADYDAVQHGARKRPGRRPTQMTLAEIDAWIVATPGQPHAIGRYQFIPKTLRRLVAILGLPPETRFSPRTQDRLADVLLVEAGLNAVTAGDIDRREFMGNLAKIWAGLPTPSGRSHYHGYAGNKATMTWARFEREMARVFPG